VSTTIIIIYKQRSHRSINLNCSTTKRESMGQLGEKWDAVFCQCQLVDVYKFWHEIKGWEMKAGDDSYSSNWRCKWRTTWTNHWQPTATIHWINANTHYGAHLHACYYTQTHSNPRRIWSTDHWRHETTLSAAACDTSSLKERSQVK